MSRRLIGYWAADGEVSPLPDPRDLVDESWDARERRMVGGYLSNGTVAAYFRGWSPCRVCGKPNGTKEFTDGTYQWPEGLAHYIFDHGVQLPSEIVEHVKERVAEIADDPVTGAWWVEATRGRTPNP